MFYNGIYSKPVQREDNPKKEKNNYLDLNVDLIKRTNELNSRKNELNSRTFILHSSSFNVLKKVSRDGNEEYSSFSIESKKS